MRYLIDNPQSQVSTMILCRLLPCLSYDKKLFGGRASFQTKGLRLPLRRALITAKDTTSPPKVCLPALSCAVAIFVAVFSRYRQLVLLCLHISPVQYPHCLVSSRLVSPSGSTSFSYSLAVCDQRKNGRKISKPRKRGGKDNSVFSSCHSTAKHEPLAISERKNEFRFASRLNAGLD